MARPRTWDVNNPPEYAKVSEPDPGESGRVCSKCKRVLSVRSFDRDSQSRDGLQHRCKHCKWMWKVENRESNARTSRKMMRRTRGLREFDETDGSSGRLKAFLKSGEYDPVGDEKARRRLERWSLGADAVYGRDDEE